jgi:hypothetical protein
MGRLILRYGKGKQALFFISPTGIYIKLFPCAEGQMFLRKKIEAGSFCQIFPPARAGCSLEKVVVYLSYQ